MCTLSKHRFYNTRAILEVLRQCDPRTGKPKAHQVSSVSVLAAVENLNHAIDSDSHVANTLLCNLYKARLARAFLPFSEDDATYRRYTVGTRAEIVDALVVIFSQMAIDAYTKCMALTTATFFFEDNCSSGGRVFSSLQRAVERGADIDWLFVVNEARLNDTEVVDDVPRFSLPVVIWKFDFHTTVSQPSRRSRPSRSCSTARRRGADKGVPARARRQRTLFGEHRCAIHQSRRAVRWGGGHPAGVL